MHNIVLKICPLRTARAYGKPYCGLATALELGKHQLSWPAGLLSQGAQAVYL